MYDRLLETINKNVMETKEEVHRIAEHILSHPATSPAGTNPSAFPPLENIKDKIHFFKQSTWQELRNRVGAKELGLNSPMISAYMEDESGEPISPGIKNNLCGDLFSYWSEIHRSGETLTNFTELGMTRKGHFRKTFEAMYPWLRFCEGHWKVDHLWINYFRSWNKTHGSPEPRRRTTKTPKPSPDPEPLQDSLNVQPPSTPTGSKRGREEPDAPNGTSKRCKGKDKQAFTPTKFSRGRASKNISSRRTSVGTILAGNATKVCRFYFTFAGASLRLSQDHL